MFIIDFVLLRVMGKQWQRRLFFLSHWTRNPKKKIKASYEMVAFSRPGTRVFLISNYIHVYTNGGVVVVDHALVLPNR